jgi:hypothetical protein
MVAGNQFEEGMQDPTFLKKIVTGDELLVFAYDLEMKMQSSEWHTVLSPDQRNHTSSDPRKK